MTPWLRFRLNLPRFRQVPLRFVLVIPFMMQITIAVGLTGWFALQNGQRAVTELATQLRERASSEIAHHLEDRLEAPQQINQLNLEAIQSSSLSVQAKDFESVGQRFWKQMQVFSVDYINFANPQGEFIGVERLDNDALLVNERSGRFPNRQLYVYDVNPQGQRTRLLERKSYDPLIEAWYADAIKARKPLWTDIYQWDDKPEILSISSSYPIYDRQQRLVGVIGVDLILSKFSQFLQSLKITPHSKTFILERNGFLVANSGSEKPFKIVRGKAQRLSAQESTTPLIQSTTRQLLAKFPDLRMLNDYQQLEFTIEEQQYFVDVMPWKDGRGIDWLIVVVVPESDIMAQIQENTQTTILLCLLSLAVAILLGLMTADWIIYPIGRLAQASRAIAHGDWDQPVQTQMIEELDVLSESFKYMVEQLKSSFNELEDRVAQRTAELARARDTAELANQAKSEFLAAASHELRTPLNAILGFAQVLQENPAFSPEHQENLRVICRNGQHLLTLINDILKVANLGAEEWNARNQSLDQTLKARADLHLKNIQLKNLSVSIERQQLILYLGQMPEVWRQQLYQAALKGFDQIIFQLIEHIPSHLSSLADALRKYIQDYQFDAVIELLEQVEL